MEVSIVKKKKKKMCVGMNGVVLHLYRAQLTHKQDPSQHTSKLNTMREIVLA